MYVAITGKMQKRNEVLLISVIVPDVAKSYPIRKPTLFIVQELVKALTIPSKRGAKPALLQRLEEGSFLKET